MAIALFVAGNFWLVVALALIIGRVVYKGRPTQYSFFGIGGWHAPPVYYFCIAACLIAAGTCLLLSLLAWWESRDDGRLPNRTTTAGGLTTNAGSTAHRSDR